jgi:hypothetical protein
MEPFIKHLMEEEAVRQESYREYRHYYDGRQGVMLTERQRQYLHVPPGTEFSANYMHIVVDSVASRLRVMRFEAKGMTETLNKWATQMRVNSIQNGIHTSAIRDGDAYGFMEWDGTRKRPVLFPHVAYDGRDGVHAHYSPDSIGPLLFSKRWTVESGPEVGVRRMNLYYGDRVERYWCHASTGGYDWMPGTGPQIRGNPSLSAVDRYEHGMPLIHFTNRSRGFRYGQSELAPGIPMQDALNKAVVDLLAATDASGFRIVVTIGFDPTGRTVAPGAIFAVPDGTPDEVSVVTVPGEALRPHIEVVDNFVQRIGQVTDTPLSYFQQSGQMASEGTHRQHEARMLAKVRSAATEFGEQWEELMRICIRMSNVYEGTNYDEDVEIEVIWDDFDIRDREEKVKARAETTAILVGAGAGIEEAALEAGFTPSAAKEFGKMEWVTMEREGKQQEKQADDDSQSTQP